MPQTLEEMIQVSEDRVIARIPTSRIVEKLPLEKLQEAKALIEWRLATMEKKKPTVTRATKGRPKPGSARS